MPIAGAVIDWPMFFMIVFVTKRLSRHKCQKHHAAKHVQRMDERERERHSVNFGRSIRLAEVLIE